MGAPSVLACAVLTAVAAELDDNKQLIVAMLVIALWAVGWSIFGRKTYGPGARAAPGPSA